MEGSENNIDALFELAREEVPRLSLEQAENGFAQALALTHGSSLAHWTKLLNFKTGITMIGGIVITTLVCFTLTQETANVSNAYQARADAKPVALSSSTAIPEIEPIPEVPLFKSAPHVIQTALPQVHEEPLPVVEAMEWATPLEAPVVNELPLVPEFEVPSTELMGKEQDPLERVSEGIETVNTQSKERTSSDEELTRVVYIVNSKTTEEELEKMMNEAESAGINMSYNAKYRKGKIKNIHMLLTISNNGEKLRKRVNIYSQGKSRFSTNITWRVNKEGRAVDFDAQGETSNCVVKTCN